MKVIRYHCAHTATACRAVLAAAALFSLVACRSGAPVLDTSSKPIQADGTISGIVRGPEGTSLVEGRTVEVVNVATGERQRVVVSNTAGFRFTVKPGKYRLELTLRDGEQLVKSPGVIDVHRSEVDAGADFVIGTSSVARPRYHVPRADDGLGAAIA